MDVDLRLRMAGSQTAHDLLKVGQDIPVAGTLPQIVDACCDIDSVGASLVKAVQAFQQIGGCVVGNALIQPKAIARQLLDRKPLSMGVAQ